MKTSVDVTFSARYRCSNIFGIISSQVAKKSRRASLCLFSQKIVTFLIYAAMVEFRKQEPLLASVAPGGYGFGCVKKENSLSQNSEFTLMGDVTWSTEFFMDTSLVKSSDSSLS